MCCHLGASLQKQLSAQTSPVQPDSLMVHLIKQQQQKDWNYTWQRDIFIIYRRNLQMISSPFPQNPQIARLMRMQVSQNQRERKKNNSAVSNYIEGDKMASQTQRQLQGCQHSSWYSSPGSSPQNVPMVGPQPPQLPPKEEQQQSAGTWVPPPLPLTSLCRLLAGHSC